MHPEFAVFNLVNFNPTPTYTQLVTSSSAIVIFAAVGKGDATDWEFDIYLMNDKIFHHSFTETANPRVSH